MKHGKLNETQLSAIEALLDHIDTVATIVQDIDEGETEAFLDRIWSELHARKRQLQA